MKFGKTINLISKIINNKFCLLGICFFDYLYTFINIMFPNIFIGALFLLVNLLCVFFLENKRGIQLIFLLYPLSRVLKIPGISTSLFTILLGIYLLVLVFRCIKNKFVCLNQRRVIILGLFLLYVLFTLLVSIICYNGSYSFIRLFSYYLHLAFPIICCIVLVKEDEINGVENIIIISFSFLAGMLYTVFYHYAIPNGDELLKNAGVNIFDMNTYGLRFSPLADDPNYGTAAIILLACLFLCAKKNKAQLFVGLPIILLNFVLSALSISKMFYLCLIVIISCYLLKLVFKFKSVFMAVGISFFALLFILIFLGTSAGNTLLIRTIGTLDGISLNRITSGRTELFGEYTSFILYNPSVLLFGKGPVYSDLSTFTNGEHNTFTTNVFGNGLIGVGLMLLVLFLMANERFDAVKRIPKSFSFYALVGCMLICFMSLSIAPSTVFPIFVVAFHYISFESDKELLTKNNNLNVKNKSLSFTEINL